MKIELLTDEQARKLLQRPFATKKEMGEVFFSSGISKQQAEALNLVDKDLREYMFSPQNAWFGQSVNVENLDGIILDSAKKHGLDSSYLHFTTYRLGVELGF